MELRYFFSVLSKRKWLLLFAMLVAAVTTWVIVGILPKKYKSAALISTGITDYRGIRVGETNPFIQEFEIDTKFANLIEFMKSRPAMNALTRQLILHDLRVPEGEAAFKGLDKSKPLGFTETQLHNYLSALERDSMGLNPNDLENLTVGRAVETHLGYDYETLIKKIDIKRNGETDYLRVEFTSDNPKLSYFVARNFSNAVVDFYYLRRDTTENKSIAFYQNLLVERKGRLDSLNNLIYNYSQAQDVVAVNEEAQALVGQIRDLEMERDRELKRKADADNKYAVYTENNKYLGEFQKEDYNKKLSNNAEIVAIDKELQSLNDKYATGGFRDANTKKQIDDLRGKKILVSQRIASQRFDNTDPAVSNRQAIYTQYVAVQADREGASSSIVALNKQLGELRKRRSALVKNNAELTKLSQEVEIAEKEYEAAFEKTNQANLINKSSGEERPVKVIDPPIMPDKPEPTKAGLMAGFAGIAVLTLSVFVLFMLSYFDSTLSSPFQFRKLVNLPFLVAVNRLKKEELYNFNAFFATETNTKEHNRFKESVRKLRHDIEISGGKSFLFTSLRPQEGKSFLIAALALALEMKGKKILIVDTNFKNNSLTGLSSKMQANSVTDTGAQMLANATSLGFHISLPSVDIMGNRGGHNSPTELLRGVNFAERMREFSRNYDFIFLEAAHLNDYADARELSDYVDMVVPIFSAATKLNKTDENGLEWLKSLGGKLLGGVLNKIDIKNYW